MKKIIFFILIIGIIYSLVVLVRRNPENTEDSITATSTVSTATSTDNVTSTPQAELAQIIHGDLEIPWDVAFLDGGDVLVTERPGKLTRISPDGTRVQIELSGVKHTSEGGLLGLKLHPDFAVNKFLYLYMSSPGQNSQTQNRVIRYVFESNTLTNEKVIIDKIPGAIYHDGGRMEFGPDGLLYITTGDATQSVLAQDLSSLAGKILRLNDDGTIPADNPFGTAVYSYGHRNPQGLVWDDQGRLWETEHGRSGVTSGYDEINLIEKGKNYGWPTIEGPAQKTGMVSPVLQSGATDTWAPASLTYLNGKLYFGGLKGETLYEVTVGTSTLSDLKRHFTKTYGRIRTTRLGPDGMIYMMTSNRDGRGKVQGGDDKIIRVNPELLK